MSEAEGAPPSAKRPRREASKQVAFATAAAAAGSDDESQALAADLSSSAAAAGASSSPQAAKAPPAAAKEEDEEDEDAAPTAEMLKELFAADDEGDYFDDEHEPVRHRVAGRACPCLELATRPGSRAHRIATRWLHRPSLPACGRPTLLPSFSFVLGGAAGAAGDGCPPRQLAETARRGPREKAHGGAGALRKRPQVRTAVVARLVCAAASPAGRSSRRASLFSLTRLLIDSFTPEQRERHETFVRSKFNKGSMKNVRVVCARARPLPFSLWCAPISHGALLTALPSTSADAKHPGLPCGRHNARRHVCPDQGLRGRGGGSRCV